MNLRFGGFVFGEYNSQCTAHILIIIDVILTKANWACM